MFELGTYVGIVQKARIVESESDHSQKEKENKKRKARYKRIVKNKEIRRTEIRKSHFSSLAKYQIIKDKELENRHKGIIFRTLNNRDYRDLLCQNVRAVERNTSEFVTRLIGCVIDVIRKDILLMSVVTQGQM